MGEAKSDRSGVAVFDGRATGAEAAIKRRKGPQIGPRAIGRSHIDESLVTGESLLIAKGIGDKVTGGAINAEGVLTVRTTAIDEHGDLMFWIDAQHV